MAKGVKVAKYDWSLYEDDIVALYESGLSVRELIPIIAEKHGETFPSGTLTNFLGKNGVLRSQTEALKLTKQKQSRLCEMCDLPYRPNNQNQRWCGTCTGEGKYTRRLRLHGLPGVVFDRMFEEQQGRCKICGKQFDAMINTGRKKSLFLDHDHETGQVRGLLCVRCNSGLSFIDDSSWHTNAQKYLRDATFIVEKVYVNPPRRRKYVRNKPVDID